jgi:hypothetical protein
VEAGVPNDDPTPGQSQLVSPELEKREADMVEKLIALAERGVPEKATVGEAVREIDRAMREDPECQALIRQLMAMIVEGGGNVSLDWGKWWRENRAPDADIQP